MPSSIDAIINRQLLKWEHEHKQKADKQIKIEEPLPIITISRQKGSRGSYFASRLAEKLNYTRLHREVIDRICLSSGFRKRVIESIDDKFRSELGLMVESMMSGQTVDYSDYFKYLCQVILSMSKLGGVVLVGRGGNFILGPKRGFHLRFIAPKEKRIDNLVNYKFLSRDEAIHEIEQSDKTRKEFIYKLFSADIDDNMHYDLVVNAAYMDIEELLDVVIKAVHGKFLKLKYLKHEKN